MNSLLEKIEESIIMEMIRASIENDAINLAENTTELSTPENILKLANEAISGGLNGYSLAGGRKSLKDLIVNKIKKETEVSFDSEKEVIITCGASEGFASSMYSLVESENGVVIPEPFYENYLPVVKLSRGKAIFLSLNDPDYSFHFTDLQKLPNFKVFILNNPHNPTGRLFSQEEIKAIGEAVLDKDAYLIVDETYKDIIYDSEYISPLNNQEIIDRTILVGSFSIILSVSGWRVGYVVAREPIIKEIKKVHYYNTICAPTPLQWACENFELSPGYIKGIQEKYKEKRDFLSRVLKKVGFQFNEPKGTYYIFSNFEGLWDGTDWGFAKYLLKNKNIAVVPGTAFYFNKKKGKRKVRFSFAQSDALLKEAKDKLASGIT